MSTHAATEVRPATLPAAGLNFLWLELTNQCNLECVHCYANSSPHEKRRGALGVEDYKDLLREAHGQGCRSVQFIGGEPTLNRSLPELIELAKDLGYELIEVYTNLVALPETLLACFEKNGVSVATSVYSADPDVHDAITTRAGSWGKTVANLGKVMGRGLPVRASVIEMEENRAGTDATVSWLHSIGVNDVGTDVVRHFGRANQSEGCEMGELCGRCSDGTLCIGSDGVVAPCIMSKAWPVGSLASESLSDILRSDKLRETRGDIYAQTVAARGPSMGGCNPDSPNRCGPDQGGNCRPCSPNTNCGPNDCRPKRS